VKREAQRIAGQLLARQGGKGAGGKTPTAAQNKVLLPFATAFKKKKRALPNDFAGGSKTGCKNFPMASPVPAPLNKLKRFMSRTYGTFIHNRPGLSVCPGYSETPLRKGYKKQLKHPAHGTGRPVPGHRNI